MRSTKSHRRAHRWLRLGIPGLLLALLCLAAGPAGGIPAPAPAEGPAALFGEVPQGRAGPALPAYVARSRYVSVDPAALFAPDGLPRRVGKTGKVTLNLFDDVAFTGVITQVERTAAGYNWTGRLAENGGYFYLITYEDAFIAHVASAEGVYEVSRVPGGRYRVIEIDQSQFIDEPPDAYLNTASADALPEADAPADVAVAADSGNEIDVLVLYTDDARYAEGSTTAMKARVALAIKETNTSYANAGITTRLRLVHTEEVSYYESGDLWTDLSRIRNRNDGYMDQAHTLRNLHGADMVSLVVENGGAYCGLASTIMASATTAFQVTVRDGCMTGYYTFGHEFGHLQGARHDTYVDSSTTPYTYGHGYIHPKTSNTAKRWRTVMAYNNKCTEVYGYHCTRLQYWSNPLKKYLADPMGNTAAQNYKVLNATDTTVANFRTRRIPSGFDSNFNTNHTGWTPLVGTWSHAGSAYYRTRGVVDSFSSIARDGRYGDLTYEARMKRFGCTSCANNLIIRGRPEPYGQIDEWLPSYLFEYTNDGYYSVWRVEANGGNSALASWAYSSAIVKKGWNTLKVVAVGPWFSFYINGSLVWTGYDDTLPIGQVGISMYRDDVSTGNDLWVDWAKLRVTPTADLSFAPSPDGGTAVPGGDITRSPGA